MINAKTFINELNKIGIEFYTGVPDSLMSEFSKACILILTIKITLLQQ